MLRSVRENRIADEELFRYSTKVPRKYRGVVLSITGLLGIAILLSSGFGTYYIMIAGTVDANSTVDSDVFLGVMLIFTALILSPFVIILLKQMMKQKSYIVEHIIYDDQVVYKNTYPKEKNSHETVLSFDNMEWSLIGNYTRYVSGRVSYFQNEALLLLNFAEDIHILTLTKDTELDQWIDFLKKNQSPIYYMPYNLKNIVKHKEQIDFNAIKKTLWHETDEQRPVFFDTMGKAFNDWNPPFKNMGE